MPSLAFGTFFDGVMARQERACLASFVNHGHAVSVFSYAPLDLPPGVEARDAADILPASSLYRSAGAKHGGTLAQFSDHFRYAMIRDTGLVWIDTDVICLAADWPEREWLLAPQDACLVNGAVLGLPREHPLLAQALDVAERLRGVSIWGVIGPHLLTALIWEHDLWGAMLPTDALYPLHYARAAELLRPLIPGESLRIPGEALCIHLWNEVLRMAGHDKRTGPPPGSALAALLDLAERGPVTPPSAS